MKPLRFHRPVVWGLALLCSALALTSAFVPHNVPSNRPSVFLTAESQPPQEDPPPGKRQRIAKWLRHKGQRVLKPAIVGGLTFFGSSLSVVGQSQHQPRFSLPALRPPAAHASAPVMAIPKAEGRDPASEAINEHERRMVQKAQAELRERDRQAREIERKQGEAARVRFEKEYQAKKEEEAKERTERIEALKRSLLDEGIDPFTDMEGRRQVTLLEKGVDLGKVSGTPFNLEMEYERRSPQKTMKVKKAAHRKVIACIVMDMKNRGVDPLEYFSTHQERTMSILDLPAATAQQLAQQYETNLEMYGQITVPKEGELSAKEKMAQTAADPKANKAAVKKAKEEEKARLKAEREVEKAKAKQAKEEEKRIKEEEKARAKQAKEEEKRLKQEEKEKAKMLKESGKLAAAAAAAGSVAAGTAASSVGAAVAGSNTAPPESTPSTVIEGQVSSSATESDPGDALGATGEEANAGSVEEVASPKVSSKSTGNILSSIKPLPAGGAVVLVAGGGYTIKMFRDKAAAEEEERQRQFRMLMGEISDSSPSTAPALEEIDDSRSSTPVKDVSPPAPDATPAPPTASKKRRLGIFKKKGERETDITKLVSRDARASEFATLLAKILTFGAPGRFPSVEALPGDKPFDSFDLDLAKQLLVESRTKDGIPTEESAEVFANVVNCMLIDIVDLASTSLKEKDSKLTIDALGIVVEFMNHAASLYDAVAESVTIKPVVYEGTLSKSKLEQMFSTYAASGMSNLEDLPEDFDSRVNLLQDVFQISEKKAEGLMMKAMQKQMMEMMKDPKKMEEMMSSMGDMEGMGDLMGGGENGEGMDTEQLMAMMRDLKVAKDRGEISKKDMESVRGMFKEAFGSSIDSIDESEVSDEDREVLAAMKEILDG